MTCANAAVLSWSWRQRQGWQWCEGWANVHMYWPQIATFCKFVLFFFCFCHRCEFSLVWFLPTRVPWRVGVLPSRCCGGSAVEGVPHITTTRTTTRKHMYDSIRPSVLTAALGLKIERKKWHRNAFGCDLLKQCRRKTSKRPYWKHLQTNTHVWTLNGFSCCSWGWRAPKSTRAIWILIWNFFLFFFLTRYLFLQIQNPAQLESNGPHFFWIVRIELH